MNGSTVQTIATYALVTVRCISWWSQRRSRQHAKISTSVWLRFVIKNEEEQFNIEEATVAQNILSYKPSFFKNAIISGLLFQSRGSSLRETMAPRRIGKGYSRRKCFFSFKQ